MASFEQLPSGPRSHAVELGLNVVPLPQVHVVATSREGRHCKFLPGAHPLRTSQGDPYNGRQDEESMVLNPSEQMHFPKSVESGTQLALLTQGGEIPYPKSSQRSPGLARQVPGEQVVGI